MRIQMRLSRPTVVAIQEYKQIKFADPKAKVTNGYLVGMAYKAIQNDLDRIDWQAINSMDIPNVTKNYDDSISDLQTALNLEAAVLDGIEKLQNKFMSVFSTKKMFKPFVIKLILFAAILKETDNLTLLKEENNNE
ncbi:MULTISPECIES: hypothetical protein [Agathobaculum]|uniref:hypothetical protein n=1 Tax=Agathobaculum TaxID=2048137 RepID=UPI0035666372